MESHPKPQDLPAEARLLHPEKSYPGRAGRPTKYSQERADVVIAAVAGGCNMPTACKQAGIAEGTAYQWIAGRPEFRRAVARARRGQAAHAADEALRIADECELDRDRIQKARLQVSARQWFAERADRDAWGTSPTVAVQVNTGARDALVQAACGPLLEAMERAEREADPTCSSSEPDDRPE